MENPRDEGRLDAVDGSLRAAEPPERPAGGRDDDDLLWRHLKTVPAFRALLRAVEARFYQHVEIPEPVLDLGCGDGHFANHTFNRPLAAGVDPWWAPLQMARRSGAYRLNVQALGDALPFADHHFASVISNSVLEHIEEVQAVLNEAGRVLRPGGRLVVTMPSHLFDDYLGGAALLRPLGLDDQYRRFFNFISRHAHTDPPEKWAARLARAGFRPIRWQFYFSRGALRTLEVGHAQGLPSAILHFLTGHWILAPWQENLQTTERWIRPYFEEPFPEQGAYIFFVAEKVADQAVRAELPSPRPFTLEELRAPVQQEEHTRQLAASEEGAAGEEGAIEAPYLPPASPLPRDAQPIAGQDKRSEAVESAPPETRKAPLGLLLLLLGVGFAALGQGVLTGRPPSPAGGLRFYVLGLLVLGGLAAWQRAGRPPRGLPRLATIPRERLLYPMALLLALLARQQGSNGLNEGRPALALLLWIVAIGLGFFSLGHARPVGLARMVANRLRPPPAAREALLLAFVLLVASLAARVVALGQHPFILNGVETSLGLGAAAVARGELRNPFATGWLTNPTLPLYLQAVPLQILGRTAIGVRLLSAVVGALTVVAIFLVGSRLWDRRVGLVAALLLAASHAHVHYSRLGMTNAWDPFWLLLSLGLLALAWRVGSRRAWLLAGLAGGLSFYFYTAGHLLPFIAAGALFYLVIVDPERLWQQKGEVLAAAALGLVVALPLLLFYRGNPGLFMERANVLGIFQSGWLVEEAARTGRSQLALLGQQLSRSLLAFNYSLDTSDSYNPGIPLFRFWPALLFVLGTCVALFRLRQIRHAILLIWLGVTLLFGGALLVGPPDSHRLLAAIPAACLLAAIGLVWLWEALVEALPDRPLQKHAVPALGLLALFMVSGDLLFYFGPYRQQARFGDRNSEIAFEMGRYLNDLEGEWVAYFHGPPAMYVDFPTIAFLATTFQPGRNLFNVHSVNEPLPSAPATSANAVFIFLPERAGERAQVAERFPGGEQRMFGGVFANPLFYSYELRR